VDVKTACNKNKSVNPTDSEKAEILNCIRNGKAELIEKKSQFVSVFSVPYANGDVAVTYDKHKKLIVGIVSHTKQLDELESIPIKVTKLLKQFGK